MLYSRVCRSTMKKRIDRRKNAIVVCLWKYVPIIIIVESDWCDRVSRNTNSKEGFQFLNFELRIIVDHSLLLVISKIFNYFMTYNAAMNHIWIYWVEIRSNQWNRLQKYCFGSFRVKRITLSKQLIRLLQ